MSSLWYVSRQLYWPDGESVVEIAAGGLDYANPDMLGSGKEYTALGCDQEYTDPREALAAAIKVRDLWIGSLINDNQNIRIEHGFTLGMTMPFASFPTDEDLISWAAAEYEELPKCEWCEDILPVGWYFNPTHGTEWKFCSEYCVDEYWAYDEEEEEK